MAKRYSGQDASLDLLEERTIAVIGYGNQGEAQAKNMRDSGCDVIVGLRRGGSWDRAKEDGFDVYKMAEATSRGDIAHILVPDEVQADVYKEKIAPGMEEGKTLCFSHGFSIHFRSIVPPRGVDVVMVAPKAPGALLRRCYKEGSGTPGLIAVAQNPSGHAKETALALSKAVGLTRIGVIETSFKEEVETDLFGEQSVLVGGISELIKAGFDTLVEAGYQPEIAYFECLHELKLIVDLIHDGGIEGMMQAVSNTAEYGGRTRGSQIINEEVRKKMKELLKDIQEESFVKEWIAENKSGAPNLKEMREEGKKHLIERIGRNLRKWAGVGE